eukprot:GHVN01049884.1.p1 GENE.GHVN01049884.1~~GHVN01049884.1.p1  ORF type:complete len:394 (+),score=41.21 GHVN01049884.1:3-1184(+)
MDSDPRRKNERTYDQMGYSEHPAAPEKKEAPFSSFTTPQVDPFLPFHSTDAFIPPQETHASLPFPLPLQPPPIADSTEYAPMQGMHGYPSWMYPPLPVPSMPPQHMPQKPAKALNPLRRNTAASRDTDSRGRGEEYPCRVLFIRNIPYGTSEDEITAQLSVHGEIKEIGSSLSKRGIFFVTYFDLRAAIAAKRQSSDMRIDGRRVYISYSFSKMDQNRKQTCDEACDQGTLYLRFVDCNSAQTREAVSNLVSVHGDVKEIRKQKGKENLFFIEFYDSRACAKALDALHRTAFQDGEIKCEYAWDYSLNVVKKIGDQLEKQGRQAPRPASPEQSAGARERQTVCASQKTRHHGEREEKNDLLERIEKAIEDPNVLNQIESIVGIFGKDEEGSAE